MRVLIALLLSSAINTALCLLDANLIKAYFAYKNVDYGSIYGCSHKKEFTNLHCRHSDLRVMFSLIPLLACAFLAFTPETEQRLDLNLIVNYFRYKHVQYGSVYGCFSKNHQIKMARSLASGNLSVTMYDIERPHFDINDTGVHIDYNRHLVLVLDADCPSVNTFLEQTSLCEVFSEVHHWLVFLKVDIILDLFRNIVLTISTDLKVAIPHEDVEHWDLYDVYNPAGAHGGSVKVKFYNIYKSPEPLVRWEPRKNMYWERKNMTGVTFKTMVVLPKDFPGTLLEYLDSEADRQVNTFNRFHSVLVYHIRDFYNFSLDIGVTKSWGYKMNNSTFDGMVRALEDKVIDFGMSPLFVKYERWPVLDYGRRTWLLRSAFIFMIPKRPASFAVFLRPLDGPVWYVTVAAAILIILLLRVTLKFEFKHLRDILSAFESSWSFLALFTFGAIFQQGAADCPNSLSSRILFIYVFVFAVLLYQFYSASIVSILLMTPARIIKNLRDLAQSQLKLGVEDVLYNRDYIGKLALDPVVSKLERKALRRGNVSFYCDPEIGLRLVSKGGYAFHVEVTTAYPIIEATFDEDTICSLDEVHLFQTQQMHQPLQKHSPFRDMLDHVLQKIDEAGLMKRQIKHWHARKPECIRSRPPTSSVSIDEFYPALSLLLIGITVSLTIFVIEHIVKRRRDRLEETEMKRRIRNKIRPTYTLTQ